MSLPRRKISRDYRKTARKASRIAGRRVNNGAVLLSEELEKVYNRPEPDPTALRPTVQRTAARYRRRNRHHPVYSILSAVLLCVLAACMIAAAVSCLF